MQCNLFAFLFFSDVLRSVLLVCVYSADCTSVYEIKYLIII